MVLLVAVLPGAARPNRVGAYGIHASEDPFGPTQVSQCWLGHADVVTVFVLDDQFWVARYFFGGVSVARSDLDGLRRVLRELKEDPWHRDDTSLTVTADPRRPHSVEYQDLIDVIAIATEVGFPDIDYRMPEPSWKLHELDRATQLDRIWRGLADARM